MDKSSPIGQSYTWQDHQRYLASLEGQGPEPFNMSKSSPLKKIVEFDLTPVPQTNYCPPPVANPVPEPKRRDIPEPERDYQPTQPMQVAIQPPRQFLESELQMDEEENEEDMQKTFAGRLMQSKSNRQKYEDNARA